MRAIVKDSVFVLVPESERERADVAAFGAIGDGHAFALRASPRGLSFHDLGPREDACREPLAITSRSPSPEVRLISNFAPTPFRLDGTRYACVEAFWQSLKFDDPSDRARVAALDGPSAKRAARSAPARETIEYAGVRVRYAGAGHWALMERACDAKFAQHERARRALLATGERWLVHPARRDSESIPSAIMCQVWMRIRSRLRETEPPTARRSS